MFLLMTLISNMEEIFLLQNSAEIDSLLEFTAMWEPNCKSKHLFILKDTGFKYLFGIWSLWYHISLQLGSVWGLVNVISY